MRFLLSTLTTFLALHSRAEMVWSGEDFHRGATYTQARDSSVAEDHWIDLVNTLRMNDHFSLKAEAYTYLGTSRGDLLQAHDYGNAQDTVGEIWPGDLYLEASGGPMLLKLGYQRISWQEGFGLSYTNFINPHDDRGSLLDSSELSYRTSPMANVIFSLSDISLQLFYLPWSESNIAAPFSRWGAASIPFVTPQQKVEVFSTAQNESANEGGGRLTWGGRGFDISFFKTYLRDRQLVYQLSPLSNLDLVQLGATHDFIAPIGATTSVEIGDYILRAEYVQIAHQQFNSFVGSTLSTYQTSEQAFSVILDTPAIHDFSFSFQISASRLADSVAGAIRPQDETLYFASAIYQLEHEKLIKLVSLLISDGTFVSQLSYHFPVSKDLEAQFAYENNGGSSGSLGSSRNDLSRAYVELDHHF